jgi:hypothetical protein
MIPNSPTRTFLMIWCIHIGGGPFGFFSFEHACPLHSQNSRLFNLLQILHFIKKNKTSLVVNEFVPITGMDQYLNFNVRHIVLVFSHYIIFFNTAVRIKYNQWL